MISIEGIFEKSILLIDDEKEILDLLETVLQKEGFKNIFKAENGHQGISICKKMKPDIIILDIMLPDFDGFEVCRQLREFSLAPVLFLSARTDDLDKLLGLGIGGDDYITKPFSPKEVAFRVKAHLRRGFYTESENKKEKSSPVYEFGDIAVDTDRSEVTKCGNTVLLTAKEYQLLVYMAENINKILSREKIVMQVWGNDYAGYDNTIMVHIRHLREKLEDDPGEPRYILTVKGLGYKLSNPSAS